MAVEAMAELAVNISQNRSKSTNEFRDVPLDIAITVCGDAAENCPIWLGAGQVVHIGFPDPAKATGTDDEIMGVFRRVRDDIKEQILPYLSDIG